MSLVDVLRQKDAYTENGAITNSTSLNPCLDLFFLAGACRQESEQNIQNKLVSSYACDPLKTLKIIFWAGDIREGAGERRFFKLALSWLAKEHIKDLHQNMALVPEFSRWSSLFEVALTDDNVLNYIVSVLLDEKAKGHSLLCKWLPRQGSVVDVKKSSKKWGFSTTTTETRKPRKLYGGLANKIRKVAKLSPKEYRKILVKGTSVVENLMCSNQWDKIDYSKVPSVAMNKYNKAWYRRGGDKFAQYLQSLQKGETKINAGAIFPHDIIKNVFSSSYWGADELNEAQIAQWNALPNYLGEEEHSILPVCDVSGSMYGVPITVSVGLGLYLSERNKGAFKDAFITFSSRPQLEYLKGDINRRIKQLSDADWGGNTNITAVFELILRRGLEEKVPQEDMPNTVLIISDMEFDCCGQMTNFEHIKAQYIKAGYEIPNIVFWNVNGRSGNVPVRVNDKGVALVSGASPSIVRGVLADDLNPVKVMNTVIEADRYSIIKIGG